MLEELDALAHVDRGEAIIDDLSRRFATDRERVSQDVRAFLGQEAKSLARGGLAFAAAGHRYFRETVARQFERLPEASEKVHKVPDAGEVVLVLEAEDRVIRFQNHAGRRGGESGHLA